MQTKKLYRFYCLDCDHAWAEVLPEFTVHAKCEYCGKEHATETDDIENI